MTRQFSPLRRSTLREPIQISQNQRISIKMTQSSLDADVYLIDTTGYLNDTQFAEQDDVNRTHHEADSELVCQYRVKQHSGNKVRIVRIMDNEEVVVKELSGRVSELQRAVYDKILVEDLLGNVLPSEEETRIEQETSMEE